MLAKDPADVRAVIDAIPDAFDVTTREGRIRALAGAGAFLGHVRDPYQRDALAAELAAKLDMAYRDVCLVVDVLRVNNGLPYEPTAGHLRHPKV